VHIKEIDMTTRNAEKETKAIQIIAAEITKSSANTPADHGTLHRSLGYTRRESIARQMAGQFVKMLYKLEMADDENDPAEIERMTIINSIVAAAVEITGK
jgi:hypothetical protein